MGGYSHETSGRPQRRWRLLRLVNPWAKGALNPIEENRWLAAPPRRVDKPQLFCTDELFSGWAGMATFAELEHGGLAALGEPAGRSFE